MRLYTEDPLTIDLTLFITLQSCVNTDGLHTEQGHKILSLLTVMLLIAMVTGVCVCVALLKVSVQYELDFQS